MNTHFACLLVVAGSLAIALPSTTVRSQLAPPPSDPMTALQALQNANDDLLKRQEATLKDLSDTTDMAREMKIFSRRS